MRRVSITSEHKYEVQVGANWKNELTKIEKAHEKILIFAPKKLEKLLKLSSKSKVVYLPDGEAQKDLKTLEKLLGVAGKLGIKRDGAIVAIGGGATTDVSGFVAATWLRGIDWYSFPTTIAGSVDAAIGGKTGINSEFGKNTIGSFHSPKKVIVDLSFIKSLSQRDFTAGLAEVVKSGFIADRKILKLIDKPLENLEELVYRSVKVKGDVVSKDFREGKLREILNYGHTLGHAIEKLEKYQLRHGEAVSIGLVFAAELSNIRGKLSDEIVEMHRQILKTLSLPTSYDRGAKNKLFTLMESDKKARSSGLRFIGLSGIGKPIWMERVTRKELDAAFERISN